MIATLPMYDWPEIRAAHDEFWQGLAQHLRGQGLEPPQSLTHPQDHKRAWHEPELFLSQTCGYPFTHQFKGRLALIGTPEYDVPGTKGHLYSSFIFARTEKPQIAAVNDEDSMSGMLALKLFAGQFPQTLITGGHVHSLEALQQARADICAIDAICVELARRYRPQLLQGLTCLGTSPLVPGLPFVTSLSNQDKIPAMQRALQSCMLDPSLAQARSAMLLKGFCASLPSEYDRIFELERQIP